MNKFGEGLEQLNKRLLEMSSLVEAGIESSIRAVLEKDRAAADQVFLYEDRINKIEVEIDLLAIDLLALHQPMASNLRFLIAALKINANLERMGDLSVNIAHSARSLIDEPAINPTVDIPRIARMAQSMVRKSIDAFVSGDVELARSVLTSDDAVDNLRTDYYVQLLAYMEQDSRNIRPALDLLSITRTLERLADHSTNIAEDVLFYVKGIEVRHHNPN